MRIEKWEDKFFFSFSSYVWVESKKKKRNRKYNLYKFTFMLLIDKSNNRLKKYKWIKK